ncbi:hypothetical protein EUX98_g3912 [Antrodiella citrinella]|uniref:Carboxylic ester hydrolase n=1 Tax=Antrodiella citrinella TaxID=2447956 RepID=A0A4S4MVF0_9APHY|nr:hypothetical protein EUX98_g3912 [Antrodiella citrinella]
MILYKPAKLANPPPLIIAMHHCQGSAQAYFTGTQYANLADTHGFIVIYPDAPDPGGCWDVHTNATLTHNAGGDSLAIASMVRYAIQNYGVDATRVFATDTSSGAMMTNVLIGAYPDLFAAGSAFSGVPYECFEGPNLWNSQCATGELIMTPQHVYPGFSGTRPKFQFWHGTADTTLYSRNFWEDIKQWTNVFGVSQTPLTTTTNDPLSVYSRASFGPNVQAILAQGVGHTVPEQANDVLTWFGLSNLTPGNPSSNPTSPPVTGPTGTPPPTGGTVAQYGQCGSIGWTGATVCVANFKCTVLNAYYSQCL